MYLHVPVGEGNACCVGKFGVSTDDRWVELLYAPIAPHVRESLLHFVVVVY